MRDRAPPLPEVLAEIAEVAGSDAAWQLAAARGGRDITIPKNGDPPAWLVDLVGKEAAGRICQHYRSNHVFRVLIPLGSAIERQRRFADGMAQGLSVERTAGLLGVHKRTVYRHRRKDREPGLFD